MTFAAPVAELIHRRYSCRTYQPRAIAADLQGAITEFLASNRAGPFGGRGRFVLVAGTESDRAALKGLGTYGFIKDAPGFIVGAVARGPQALEEFGYLLERAILRATDLGLGTCWLGGSFSRSNFARKIVLTRDEDMPAVAAVGYAEEGSRAGRIRQQVRADSRVPAETLFFEEAYGRPLSRAAAGPYTDVLEAVRWAPSASNKQPWRVVRTSAGWHFYLERTEGYGKGTLIYTLMRMADLQRVDLGIAMCHFELVARELGLQGTWVLDEPVIARESREYIATWRPAQA